MRFLVFAAVLLAIAGGVRLAGQVSPRTRVVLLGTGTPRADPDRSGPATAIIANDTAYLVDAGPGIVRRAAAAAAKGIRPLSVDQLRTLFVTHLHSDHTVGLPDLIFTPWVQGRHAPLQVFGPAGTQEMTRHILLAWQADVDIRTQGLEQRPKLEVNAHDIKPGVVYKDQNVTVTAFQNAHGEWPQSFGYAFQTSDRTIVISGDTSPSASVVDACRKCDVLIHEVFSENYAPADMPNWVAYRSRYHTTTRQLVEIANKTQPALLILHHRGAGSAEEYLSDIRHGYGGRVVVGNDLDVY